ncbi:MAG TPA: tetratricopeptide repeat protein [Candidatus Acidoferrum sp.]|nr:tetratricopeptide repeat protein [Candidatus Acidoferrum sp.]
MGTKLKFGFGLALFFLACVALVHAMNRSEAVEAALRAYTEGEYPKAVQILQAAAAKEPGNSELYLLLSKSFYEMKNFEKASESAEKAIAIDPQNSINHEWLGRAYGERADRAGWFSAISLAKKARKEFATAVELDERNFSAMQALIEFDCAAPGMVGGGEDKAAKEIEKIAALDVAEGHYARGNCRRQKKNYEEADAEFTKALQSNPKSADLVYDIGDFAMKRDQADRLITVSEIGERLDSRDPRGAFYRAVADILRGEKLGGAEKTIRDYLDKVPRRNTYPSPAMGHYWLGRLFERQKLTPAAITEYETALKLEPKNHYASDALKRAKKQ